jgi:hypothetical protein
VAVIAAATVAASAAVASVEAVSEAGASNLFPQEIKGLYGWKAARVLPSIRFLM